ncbi:MAG TPA: hypothetical protein VJQ58_00530 [Burkholderiales bacterium]|nr:hypothetical protein [Burkholderiales bacterium]
MDSSVESLRDAAFDLYTAAREASEYEVAYHALCAVLHAAERIEDAETCRLVEVRANECRDWVDTRAPEHRLSSQSAKARGHESIFRQLAVMGESARLRINAEAQKKKGRP